MAVRPGETELWLRRFHPAPDARVRLVCFPHAGAGAGFFAPFADLLSPSTEVLGVQYPGRQDRAGEPCAAELGELADRVHNVLSGLTGRPLALFGHGMGATVAYEVAHHLERDGAALAGLFASASGAPSRHPGLRRAGLDDDGLSVELRAYGGGVGMPPDVAETRVLLDDYAAVGRYQHRPRAMLDCPVNVFVGDADPLTAPVDARAWAEHTLGPVVVRVFTGAQSYVVEHRADVAAAVIDRLAPFTMARQLRMSAP